MQCNAGSELSDVQRASYCGGCESYGLISGCMCSLSALNIFVYRRQVYAERDVVGQMLSELLLKRKTGSY